MRPADTTYDLPKSPTVKRRTSPFFQSKLTINKPNDRYEHEADHVAEQVMRMQVPSIQNKQDFFFRSALPVTPIQRKCEHCEEEEKKMQRKEMNGEQTTTDTGFEQYVGNLGQSGQTLSREVRNFFEPRFGYDFSNVKIHTNTVAAKSALLFLQIIPVIPIQ